MYLWGFLKQKIKLVCKQTFVFVIVCGWHWQAHVYECLSTDHYVFYIECNSINFCVGLISMLLRSLGGPLIV